MIVGGQDLIPTTDLVGPADIATELVAISAGTATDASLFTNFVDAGIADLLPALYVDFD